MSAPRRRDARFNDRRKGNASAGGVPRHKRLLDLMHEDHLAAVVALGESGPPLVVIAGAGEPTPMLALVEGGLAGVMTERGRVLVLGAGEATFPLACERCGVDLELNADALRDNIATRPARRTPRLVV